MLDTPPERGLVSVAPPRYLLFIRAVGLDCNLP